MSSEQYEVEIKSLLGSSQAADKLRADLKSIDPSVTCLSTYTQLNHYFEGGDPLALADRIAPHLDEEQGARMRKIASEGKNMSIRSREMSGEVRFVMKASIGDDSSANGVMRLELDAPIAGMTMAELDEAIMSAGYHYQAKWSRTREDYKVNGFAISLDKNAGYGYLAEFEKVVDDASKAEEAKQEVIAFMAQLGVAELPQDRLERMFAYYNAHWPEYYGTENIFVIE